MNELFSIDFKDYDPAWPVFTRASVRGVIIRDGKVLLMYSQKYSYYKFPGGGIEGDESHAETLCREVREESGYCVIPESIREYGYVPRRQKDSKVDGIFMQDNYYYFCDVSDEPAERQLDDYEEQEGFTPVWIEPLKAWYHNRHDSHGDADRVMIKRDTKVLDMIDVYVRKELHRTEEEAWIASLGEPYYADMLSFVGDHLGDYTGWTESKLSIKYSRFEHIKRVVGWCLRLYELSERKAEIDRNILIISAIFHDVGYRDMTPEHSHQDIGADIAREYLPAHGFDQDLTDRVCYLIANHSYKWMMQDPAAPADLIMLMEADLIDDMGALGITMDTMIERAQDDRATFVEVLDHIARYTLRQQKNNPMVTPEGRLLWDRKTALTEQFYNALEADIFPWK